MIDTDALIKSIIQMPTNGNVFDIIRQAPTIEPQKWIPVSERLPEIGEYVLCSQENGDVGEGKLLDYDSWLICYDQTCRGSYWVNAWQPLPDPWKETKE